MAYAYKGNDFKEPVYLNEPLPASKCGTRAGYRQHQNNGEPVCDECTEAHADYMRDYMRDYRERTHLGSMTAYRAHLKAGETPCDKCKAVNAAYQENYQRRKRRGLIKTGWTDEKCGTVAGYALHYRYAMPVCDRCKAAQAIYQKALRIKKMTSETHSFSTGTAA